MTFPPLYNVYVLFGVNNFTLPWLLCLVFYLLISNLFLTSPWSLDFTIDTHSSWGNLKNENNIQLSFCIGLLQRQRAPHSSPFARNYTASQHQAAIARNRLWDSVLSLSLFCASNSKMCPMVTVSLLYAIPAHKRSHRNTLLLASQESLHLQTYPLANIYL